MKKSYWYPKKISANPIDPFRTVLFSDIKPFLIRIHDPLSALQSIIQLFYKGNIVIITESQNCTFSHSPLKYSSFDKDLVQKMELEYNGSTQFIKRILHQFRPHVGDLLTNTLMLSLESCISIKSLKKNAKKLFKSEQATKMWIRYLAILYDSGELDDALAICGMLIGQVEGPCYELARLNCKIHIDRNEPDLALEVLVKCVTPGSTSEGINT